MSKKRRTPRKVFSIFEQKDTLKKYFLLYSLILMAVPAFTQSPTPTPTPAQLKWQDMEFYLFAHFGPNTFTGMEWGKGTEKAEVFNPSGLDCEQWCRIAKAAGAKGIIITAKHHDGFCLWPSKYSTHTVRESQWKNGKGDVLKDLSEACKKYGLKFGVYLSPWDRNHPEYGTPAYNNVFINMLKEIFQNYGPIWELWWDGANGEGPNGKKQVYDFPRFEKVIRSISPNTIIFSDIGPDARWCGNEKGFAGTTNWNNLDTAGFKRGEGAPPTDTLNSGNMYGRHWIPAECDVSIRAGWFYHENEKPKSPDSLFSLYLKSIGRGANLLLNVPPDDKGLFNPQDSASLMGFKKLRDENFANDLSKKAKISSIKNNRRKATDKMNDDNNLTFETISSPQSQSIGLAYNTPEKINCVVLQENLVKGQQCIKFKIMLLNKNSDVVKVIDGTTIGHKRILTFPETEASTVVFSVVDQKAPTRISEIKVFHINENLIEKTR